MPPARYWKLGSHVCAGQSRLGHADLSFPAALLLRLLCRTNNGLLAELSSHCMLMELLERWSNLVQVLHLWGARTRHAPNTVAAMLLLFTVVRGVLAQLDQLVHI